MSAEGDIKRYRDEISRLRRQVSDKSAAVATARKREHDANQAAMKASSASTVKSKLSEAERQSKTAIDAERARAGIEKKLAGREADLFKAMARRDSEQVKAQKDQDARQKRALDDLRRSAAQSADRFRPTLTAFDSARDVLTFAESPEGEAHDVFISHASEDKDAVARPLEEALRQRNITAWFDELNIQVGQSIRAAIERGIANCRFGVVIVSPHFFQKSWTNAELDGLFGRQMTDQRDLILPIWHHVSVDDVQQNAPMLAGRLALNTAVESIDTIADRIAAVIEADRA